MLKTANLNYNNLWKKNTFLRELIHTHNHNYYVLDKSKLVILSLINC